MKSVICLQLSEDVLGLSDSDRGSRVLNENVLDNTVLDDGDVSLRAVVSEESAGIEGETGCGGEL